jgi:hypothetical protein
VQGLPQLLGDTRHGVDIALHAPGVSQRCSRFESRQMSAYQLASVADPIGDVEELVRESEARLERVRAEQRGGATVERVRERGEIT